MPAEIAGRASFVLPWGCNPQTPPGGAPPPGPPVGLRPSPPVGAAPPCPLRWWRCVRPLPLRWWRCVPLASGVGRCVRWFRLGAVWVALSRESAVVACAGYRTFLGKCWVCGKRGGGVGGIWGRGMVCLHNDAGWSSSVARWAHNPEVAGSNPVPATEVGGPCLRKSQAGPLSYCPGGATPRPRPEGLRPPDPLWGCAPRPPAVRVMCAPCPCGGGVVCTGSVVGRLGRTFPGKRGSCGHVRCGADEWWRWAVWCPICMPRALRAWRTGSSHGPFGCRYLRS